MSGHSTNAADTKIRLKMIANPPPWPDGKRCAVAFTFDEDCDSILHLAHHKNATNLVTSMSMLQYRPKIATSRILALYREFGLKQPFLVPAWSIERYPEVVEAILRDGHEIGHHGYIHELPNELTREREESGFYAVFSSSSAPAGRRHAPQRGARAKTTELRDSENGGVSGCQSHPRLQAGDSLQKFNDLVARKNNRELARLARIWNMLWDRILAERYSIEEPECADDLVQFGPGYAGRHKVDLEKRGPRQGRADPVICRNGG